MRLCNSLTFAYIPNKQQAREERSSVKTLSRSTAPAWLNQCQVIKVTECDNDGKLVFTYDLEDTDSIAGDQVYNGQDSVLFNNIREAFGDELKAMYRRLRSGQIFNFEAVNQRFIDHQAVWPIRLWNEDAYNKYLKPFLEEGYDKLAMLQGDKGSQREQFLYGAFKYRDSKYEAGDATKKVIKLRGYTDDAHPISNQGITLTAYAPIYGLVDYASGYKDPHRMAANETRHFPNTMDHGMWNTEIYIHSADQLSDVGDLSPLNAGEADFSAATKLNRLVLGSNAVGYVNDKLTSLAVGTNDLLELVNVCNCTALVGNIDLHTCSGIETILATGSAIAGVQLPVGGHVKRMELPATITNLTIRNQKNLTTLTMEGYSSLSTLRIENTPNVPIETIINNATNLARVRLMGIEWNATDNESLAATIARLDTCMGLDQADNTTEKPVIYGRVNVGSISGELLEHIQDNYPNLVVVVNGVPNYIVYFRNYDGTKLYAQAVSEGGDATDPVSGGQIIAPTRPMDVDGTTYNYNGWGVLPTNIHENKTVTAQYIPAYKVQWVNDDGTVLQTKQVVTGQSTQYTGSTPTKASTAQYTYAFKEWTGADDRATGAINQVTGPKTVTATYTNTVRQYAATFYAEDRTTVLQSSTVNYGTTVQYTGTTPTSSEGGEFLGWEPSNMVITGNTSFYPKFQSAVQDVEITDDLATICANVDNGTYATKYKAGNYKPMDLGTEGTINMQIVAIDNEEGPLVFVAKELLVTSKQMNSTGTNANGYPATDVMRPYLNDTILPLVPEVVRQHIKAVSKTSYDKTTGADVTSTEKLWIPSAREIFGGSSYEQSGPVYSTIYKDSTSRKKTKFGSSSFAGWWLRSAHSSSDANFRNVYDYGSADYTIANNSRGVCLGFVLSSDNIADSWEQIGSAISDGTYRTKYAVGDSKIVDLGDEGAISMQIVAFDTDELADGSGNKAAITWVAKQLLVTGKAMNSTNTNANGYPATTVMRPYLQENGTIWNKLPANVKSLIKAVSKTSYDYTTGGDLTSTEKLWIPSAREIFGGSSYEQSGPVYSTIYKDSTSRKKTKFGSSSFTNWWLRSANSYYDTAFRHVRYNGSADYYDANNSYGVCLSFCTGASAPKPRDGWDDLADSIAAGTYATDYSIGDTIPLDLGDEGTIDMEIVAFDTDDLASGSGKAPVTFVAKQLLVTGKQMNTAATNANGYLATEVMRPYLQENGTIWNKLPANVKSLIKAVSKTSYDKTTGADVTSTEKLWIPSAREIFGGTSYEQSGPVYSAIYKDSTSRKRTKFGSSSFTSWWLRSAYSGTNASFRNVDTNGNADFYNASNSHGVCLGFCV